MVEWFKGTDILETLIGSAMRKMLLLFCLEKVLILTIPFFYLYCINSPCTEKSELRIYK